MKAVRFPRPYCAKAAELEQLGDYRILREVGRGGMGVVYEAEQISLARHVALKILPQRALLDKKQRRRFEREAKAAGRLHHTNIVPVFGVGEHDGTPYYVMQFIHGRGLDAVLEELRRLLGRPQIGPARDFAWEPTKLQPQPDVASGEAREVTAAEVARSLLTGVFEAGVSDSRDGEPGLPASPTDAGANRLRALGELPPAPVGHDAPPSSSSSMSSLSLPGGKARGKSGAETYYQGVARIGAQVAEALAYAHAQGVVHRDVKPANLLLDNRGTVWVTDFGLAKADDHEELTRTGDLLGTLRFIPPEAFGGRADARGDIYSLGLTLYEMVALRPAFDEKDRMRLVKQICESQAPRLSRLNRDVPRDLETIIHKAIERAPEHRYGSASELAADLERFLDDRAILARRASFLERYARWARHHPDIAVLGGVLTAVLVAVAVASMVAASRFERQARRQTVIAAERESERVAAVAARTEAELARGEAEAARQQAETVVVDMHAARGLLAAERDEAARAMLWFAKAAELSRRDPNRERLNRIRALAWERKAAVPVQAFDHGGNDVTSAAFHPSGALLLTVSVDQKARVWRLDDGSETVLPPDGAAVGSAAWSPDGTRLALGLTGAVRVYDVSNRSLPRELSCAGPVTALAFSRDGRLLAGGGARVTVWDLQTGSPIGRERQTASSVVTLEFNARGDCLLVGCRDGALQVFDVPSASGNARFAVSGVEPAGSRFTAAGDAVLAITGPTELRWLDAATGQLTGPGRVGLRLSSAKTVGVSADGRWIAVAGYYGPELFATDAAAATRRLLEHNNEVKACQFSPDSKLLASASFDRTVKLWSIPGGNLVGAPLPHEHMVTGLTFAADGRYLATWQLSGLLRVWRLAVAQRVVPLATQLVDGAALRTSRDGRRAIAGRFHNLFNSPPLGQAALEVFDLATGQPAGNTVVLPGAIQDAVLDSEGKRGAALTSERGVSFLHVWDVESGRSLFAARPLDAEDAISIDFRGDDSKIAVLTRSGQIRLLDAADGRVVFSQGPPIRGLDSVVTIRFAGDDAVVALYSGWLSVIDTRSMRLRFPPVDVRCGGQLATALALAPDGRLAAVGGSGWTQHAVRVWDLQSGQPASSILPHADYAFAIAFTPDGRRLATGGRDGQLRVWDWRAGRMVGPPGQASDEIFSIAFLPDPRFIATGTRNSGESGKIEFWDLATTRPLAPSIDVSKESVTGLVIAPDGRRALAAVHADRIYAVNLSDLLSGDDRTAAELVREGELAAGQRVLDGDLAGLTVGEWLDRWRSAPPRFREPARPSTPIEPIVRQVVRLDHHADGAPGGWRRLATEALLNVRSGDRTSGSALRGAVYSLLAGDTEGYQETCQSMLRQFATTNTVTDADRTAKVCLLRDINRPLATRLAEQVGRVLDAGTAPDWFVPWGLCVRALSALRNGRADDARRWAAQAQKFWGGDQSQGGVLAATIGAMAEQDLGRSDTRPAHARFRAGCSAAM